ncbi:uncharacterized protein RJT20DRAFT_131599 [Scheffersomyces xylosifermentans]|uniref:uncharacterized protein n=1 Tax=Scheffersomyces xylosifermentans TaxID=1304137 RepID=UPI00315CCE71
MVSWNNRISGPIAEISEVLTGIVESIALKTGSDKNYLEEQVDSETLKAQVEALKSALGGIDYDYKIEDNVVDKLNEAESKKLQSFNDELEEKVKDVVITSAYQNLIDSLALQRVHEYQDSEVNEVKETVLEFHGYKLSQSDIEFFNKISIILDSQIYLFLNEIPFVKHILYESLSRISRFLLSISTSQVDIFWYYLESREVLIQEQVFDSASTGDRIAVLDLCNTLTDKFIFKDSKGRSDTYKKDSFNDKFQFRVRVFITNIFAFEDNTGLNKYFHLANRAIYEVKTKSPFVEDLMAIEKLFNDPYFYLKKSNQKELPELLDRLFNVYEYLKEKELAFQGTLRIDPYLISPPKTDAEKKYLTNKYSSILYFPEAYFKSAFVIGNKAEQEKFQGHDREFFIDQFKTSSIRLQYLVKIFLISNFYIELIPRHKDEFLDWTGAPSNVKHIVDDSFPDSLRSTLFKIKKDLFSSFKPVDPQFAFLLQHIVLGEKFWWSWLIYGKDPVTHKPIFADKRLTTEELTEAQENAAKMLPFKEKKYFNTYVTPQLARKMRVKRDLSSLESKPSLESEAEVEEKLKQLSEKIIETKDKSKKEELVDERNCLLWKKLKTDRQTRWLKFGELLTTDMLADHAEDEMEVEEEKQELEKKAEEEDTNALSDDEKMEEDPEAGETVPVEGDVNAEKDEEPEKKEASGDEGENDAGQITAGDVDDATAAPASVSVAVSSSGTKRGREDESDESVSEPETKKVKVSSLMN